MINLSFFLFFELNAFAKNLYIIIIHMFKASTVILSINKVINGGFLL